MKSLEEVTASIQELQNEPFAAKFIEVVAEAAVQSDHAIAVLVEVVKHLVDESLATPADILPRYTQLASCAVLLIRWGGLFVVLMHDLLSFPVLLFLFFLSLLLAL